MRPFLVVSLISIVLAMEAGSVLISPASSAEADSSVIACSDDNPEPCLNRHGEALARTLDKAYKDVANKLNTSCFEVIELGIGECLDQAQKIADRKLNETYYRAMKSIDNDSDGRKWRERLKLAQQAWLRFRDADCGDLIDSEWMQGTGAGAAAGTCQLGHTEARIAELNRRYSQ